MMDYKRRSRDEIKRMKEMITRDMYKWVDKKSFMKIYEWLITEEKVTEIKSMGAKTTNKPVDDIPQRN